MDGQGFGRHIACVISLEKIDHYLETINRVPFAEFKV
jgi:hypothetical protein